MGSEKKFIAEDIKLMKTIETKLKELDELIFKAYDHSRDGFKRFDAENNNELEELYRKYSAELGGNLRYTIKESFKYLDWSKRKVADIAKYK